MKIDMTRTMQIGKLNGKTILFCTSAYLAAIEMSDEKLKNAGLSLAMPYEFRLAFAVAREERGIKIETQYR